ncbi:HD domain protein [Niveomyces insectorum RCEF 264]|uniref:HD domain protein n=1 Tax=Niveomyces insectorum RCEF 264 TaxID=1081102 RepID=A0A167TGF8_9HYPO|nr:HD domain protein [Niveomyces insectorum RCEF 264]
MDSTPSPPPPPPLTFLHLLHVLKHLPRTGWLRTIDRPESVAGHSFGLALLGGFAPAPLDKTRCVFIGLCHDLAESVVGDIPTYAGVPKERKHKLEASAFQYIASLIERSDPAFAQAVTDAWLDYEEGRTAEGRWMKEMDKFECLTWGDKDKDLSEFQGLSAKLVSPTSVAWLAALQQARSAYRTRRQDGRLPVVFLAGVPRALSARVAADLGFRHIALEEVLRAKAQDPSYPHAAYLLGCLDDDIGVFVGLTVRLLQEQLEQAATTTADPTTAWTLVSGFPNTKQELAEFEREVQKPNFVVLLRHGPA